MTKITEDPRIDPRIKAVFGAMDLAGGGDVENREAMLEAANTEEAITVREGLEMFLNMCDSEEIAPSAGLTIEDYEFSSEPDGNTAKIQYIRPTSETPLPCVYYIHGGGMASLQALTISIALPFVIVMLMMCVGLFNGLRAEKI